MTDFHELFFGVLGKDYCLWYYILMILSFTGIVLSIIRAVVKIATSKKIILSDISNTIVGLVFTSSGYFTNRMLYSMCLT
jgi:hypothetical protein